MLKYNYDYFCPNRKLRFDFCNVVCTTIYRDKLSVALKNVTRTGQDQPHMYVYCLKLSIINSSLYIKICIVYQNIESKIDFLIKDLAFLLNAIVFNDYSIKTGNQKVFGSRKGGIGPCFTPIYIMITGLTTFKQNTTSATP